MQVEEIMQASPVIPVIVIKQLEQAVPLARALVDGGLRVLEVTLRSEVAMEAIAEIAKAVPEAILGVGTVTRPEQFAASQNAGATFAVSPGLTETLATASRDCNMPFLPGVFTPGDVMRAQEMGFNSLKLFPAQQAGGIGMLKALGGPLADARFCPTGGVGADNFSDFLQLPNVVCVGGSWVCPGAAVEAQDWDRITHLAHSACSAVS